MKKRTKIAFGFIALISFTSLTYALTTPVQVSGEIRNKVTADLITTRNTVSGTGTVGKYIETYGTNIKNISGENANGGIRVRTVVKEKKDYSIQQFLIVLMLS